MQNAVLSKSYAGFSIIYCSLMSFIAVMTIVIPTYSYGLNRFDEAGIFLYQTVIAVLTLVVFTPQPIALMSYYFSGGIGSVTGSRSIYSGTREATYPHWFMLGSIAWALIGLSAFWRTTSDSNEGISNSNSARGEIQAPVASTFKANSNRKLYLILGGIVAAVLIGVFSIVGVAVGMMHLSRPTTTFEGIPNTNRTQIKTNSNQQLAPATKDLKALIESRKNLFGDFKLYQISKSELKHYPNPKDKIHSSFYSEREPKKLTFIDVSVFNNVDDARKEAEFRRKYIAGQKMKVTNEKNRPNGVSISFRNKEFYEVFECEDEVCFSVKDRTESVTSAFRLWIFKQIVPEAKRIAKTN